MDTPPSNAPADGTRDGKRRLPLRWRVLLFLAAWVATYVGVSMVVGIGAVVVIVVRGDFTDPGALTSTLENERVLLLLQMLVSPPLFLAAFGLCALFRKGLDQRPIRTLGLGRPERGWAFDLVVGFVVGAVPLVACVLLLVALGGLELHGVQVSVFTLLFVPVLAMMAFTEEVVCRGYLLRNFMDARRPWLGLLVSSLVFWAAHVFNTNVWSSVLPSINLLGAGVVLGLAYLAADNLWFPTALHLAWNLAQGVLFESPVSGIVTDGVISVYDTNLLPDWLVGGGFGLEGSVLVTFFEIVLAAGLYWWWKRNTP